MEQPAITTMSFAYGQGLPDVSTDTCLYIFDCRTIRDPMWDSFAEHTGMDSVLVDRFEHQQPMIDFMSAAWQFVQTVVNQAQENVTNRRDAVFAFGCTHGRHRSVYCANALGHLIATKFQQQIQCVHRDQDTSYIINST